MIQEQSSWMLTAHIHVECDASIYNTNIRGHTHNSRHCSYIANVESWYRYSLAITIRINDEQERKRNACDQKKMGSKWKYSKYKDKKEEKEKQNGWMHITSLLARFFCMQKKNNSIIWESGIYSFVQNWLNDTLSTRWWRWWLIALPSICCSCPLHACLPLSTVRWAAGRRYQTKCNYNEPNIFRIKCIGFGGGALLLETIFKILLVMVLRTMSLIGDPVFWRSLICINMSRIFSDSVSSARELIRHQIAHRMTGSRKLHLWTINSADVYGRRPSQPYDTLNQCKFAKTFHRNNTKWGIEMMQKPQRCRQCI